MCHAILMLRGIWDWGGEHIPHHPRDCVLFFVAKKPLIFLLQSTTTSQPMATEGYAATQLLGGQLADALGSKWVLAAGLSCWSLATAFTPLAAANGAAPLLATRLALGLGEGGMGWMDELCQVVGKMTEKNCRKVPSLWRSGWKQRKTMSNEWISQSS